jgi:hypothetical protein
MKVRNAYRVLVVSLCVMLGLVATVPAFAAQSAPSRIAAAGIDISKYKSGWTLVGDELQWDNGTVVMPLEPQLISECPSGWVCLFANAHFDDWNQDGRDDGARMAKFSATGRWLDMADWNFNDQMSSWYNRRGLDARWYVNAWPQNPPPAYCMNPGATGTYDYGDSRNDKMSMLWIYTTTTVC